MKVFAVCAWIEIRSQITEKTVLRKEEHRQMNIDACMNRKQRLLSNQSPTHRADQWTNQNSRASCHAVRVKRGKTAVTRLVFSLLLIGQKKKKVNSATLVSSELITCKGVLTVCLFLQIQFKTMRESLTELNDVVYFIVVSK